MPTESELKHIIDMACSRKGSNPVDPYDRKKQMSTYLFQMMTKDNPRINRLYGTLATYNPQVPCLFITVTDDLMYLMVEYLRINKGINIHSFNKRAIVLGCDVPEDDPPSSVNDPEKFSMGAF